MLRLAAPMTMVALVNMAMSVTDTLMAAQFGVAGLAAVAIGSDFYSLVFVFAAGTISGLATLYAAAAEAENTPRLRRLRAAGWLLALLLGALLAPLIWTAPGWLGHLGIPSDLLDQGRNYTRAMATTLLPMLAVAVMRNRLVARERPGAILRVTLGAIPLNAALNRVLMHGVGPWEGLGITGAGVSSLIVACSIAIALSVICLRQGDVGADWRAGRELAEALRLGPPIGVTMLAELGVFLGATLFAARFGPEAAAAHALTLRLAGIVYAVTSGLQQAATVRMARQAEAGDPRWPLRAGVRLGLAAGAVNVALLCTIATPLSRAVFADPATAATAAGLILLLALSEAAAPLGAVAAGLMRGLRDTRVPMLFSLGGNWGVTLPMAVLLAGAGWGVTGLWAALTAGTLAASLLTTLRLRRHRPAAVLHLQT
ncbi:MATE family efflux transporter [Maritimibacter sp. HL-12]|uniref:MATE family efflux transporter n=1 Tax=Maritimibacter sp. HL-12 TaxID=1162418 RepID=UPI0015941B24|nr:MATE family efflux transporter [Maritimibacter sp. HL-12]